MAVAHVRAVLSDLLDSYTRRRGKTVWCEKTPRTSSSGTCWLPSSPRRALSASIAMPWTWPIPAWTTSASVSRLFRPSCCGLPGTTSRARYLLGGRHRRAAGARGAHPGADLPSPLRGTRQRSGGHPVSLFRFLELELGPLRSRRRLHQRPRPPGGPWRGWLRALQQPDQPLQPGTGRGHPDREAPRRAEGTDAPGCSGRWDIPRCRTVRASPPPRDPAVRTPAGSSRPCSRTRAGGVAAPAVPLACDVVVAGEGGGAWLLEWDGGGLRVARAPAAVRRGSS